jgi:hypothetical protein
MKILKLLLIIGLLFLIPNFSFAHGEIQSHPMESNSDLLDANATPSMETPINNPLEMMSPVSILKNIMNDAQQEQSPILPDVSYTPDPGNPDAPIDSKIWILIILVLVVGVLHRLQFEKQ